MVFSTQAHNLLPLRLVIADDNQIARISLRSMLESNPHIVIVGEAACGEDVIALCQCVQPTIVLIDVRMPGIDGFAATEAIVRAGVSPRVIIITMHDHPSYLVEAFRVGATGYLLKDSSYDELMLALEYVCNGYRYVAKAFLQSNQSSLDDALKPPCAAFPMH